MKNQTFRNIVSIFRLIYFVALPIYIWGIKDLKILSSIIVLSYIITTFFSKKFIKTFLSNLFLAAFFYLQIYLLLILSSYLGENVNPSIDAIKPALKVFAILSGLPLVVNGRLLDDLLVAFSIFKYPSFSNNKLKFNKLDSMVLFILFLPVIIFLLLPYQFKQIHYYLKLRNTLPLSNYNNVKLLLKSPIYFIWELHIEPAFVKTLTGLSTIEEAIKQKGF